ncbi:hypothetical protein GCM10022221_06970 [Actinocorallia aurea]
MKAEAARAEEDAVKWPEERGELLLEAAHLWAEAGEPGKALEIYEELVASGEEEDAQYARVGRIEVLARVGRVEEAEGELARLKAVGALPGPAAIAGEWLESEGRLEEALVWFNLSCREFLALDEEELADVDLYSGYDLVGRARVRAALGLPPDTADRRVTTDGSELMDEWAEPAAGPARVLGSFFVASDVARAFAEGLVHGKAKERQETYFREVELGWRASSREAGVSRLTVLPQRVDDVLAFAAARGLDATDQETRLDQLREAAETGASTFTWPPGRNEPCWCASGRKYKKCCGV